MTEAHTEYTDPTLYAIPFFVAALLFEIWYLTRRRQSGDRSLRGYEGRDSFASIFAGASAMIAWLPLLFVQIAIGRWFWEYRLFDLGTGAVGWFAALLAWDFSFYWQHRSEHGIRFLWAGHVTHHSSQYYNLSTALRQSWTPWTHLLFYTVWSFLGVRPEMMVVAGSMNLIYQYWIHTEAVDRLPAWYEYIFNTPSHHRVHHGTNPQYLDKNHGGVLILWDRLFGTFEPETERVVFGLTKNIDSFHPVWIQIHEYVAIARDVARATSWRDRLAYVFAGPGWAPSQVDGAALGTTRGPMLKQS